MAKRVNSASLKGILTVDWSINELILTESTKDGDFEYSLTKLIDEFNGKAITFSIKEEDSITPIEEDNDEIVN